MVVYPVIFRFKTKRETPLVVKDGGDCHICALNDDTMTCDYQFPYCVEKNIYYAKAKKDDLCDESEQ